MELQDFEVRSGEPMWDFLVSKKVVACIDERGLVWTPTMLPMGEVAENGDVFVGRVLAGHVDQRGYIWGPGMRLLGWAQTRQDLHGGVYDPVSVYALGGHLITVCEDFSCPLMYCAGVGLILWATGAIEWDFEDDWRLDWISAGAPNIRFPQISFLPKGGVLVENPGLLRLSEELESLLMGYRYSLRKRPSGRSGQLPLGAARIESWVRETLDNFRSPGYLPDIAEAVDLMMSSVSAEALSVALDSGDGLKQVVQSWLTAQLAARAIVEDFEPRVQCCAITTAPVDVSLEATDVRGGFNEGWTVGWHRSMTLASKFTDEEIDWALATECLEIDPEVKWWLRVRPASYAITIPVGDPINLSYTRPDFIVVDSRDRAWVVIVDTRSQRRFDQKVIAAAAERWIRACQWVSCGQNWGLVVAMPMPRQPITWDRLVSLHEVRP